MQLVKPMRGELLWRVIASMILVSSAMLKIVSLFQPLQILSQFEPLFGISYRLFLVCASTGEIAVAVFLLISVDPKANWCLCLFLQLSLPDTA